jgi:TRAP-type uncharacterized transport system fused permease subunit
MTDPSEITGQPTILQLYVVQTQMNSKLDVLLLTDSDHEARLRALERSKWPLPSIAVLVALAGAVTGVISMTR